MARLLICGDIHGHIHHLLDLVEVVEDYYGTVDAVLQVGDMGVWDPVRGAMDRATLKFATEDPDELALLDLLRGGGMGEERLASREWPPVYFVRGNHDDGEFLRSIGNGTLDSFDVLHNIPGGDVVEIAGLAVGALGGVYYPAWNNERSSFYRYTQPVEARRLLKKKADLIISHDAPAEMMGPGTGSPWLSAIIERNRPSFVFCGHYHRPATRAVCGKTEVWELNQIHSPRRATTGFAGILDGGKFTVLERAVEKALRAKWYPNL